VPGSRVKQVARDLYLPVFVVDKVEEADVLITAKSYYRRRPQAIVEAEEVGMPIHVLRNTNVSHIQAALADLFELSIEETDPLAVAMRETLEAIRRVQAGVHSVDLRPQNSYVRRRQHEAVRQANLVSHSYGKDHKRHVRVFRE